VVEEALEILAASLTTDVRLERRLDAGDTAVVGDATQLHQVAMNLCTNGAAGDGARRGAHGGAGESGGGRAPAALARHAVAGSVCAPVGERHRQRIPPAGSSACSIRSSTTKGVGDAPDWACRWCMASSPTSAAHIRCHDPSRRGHHLHGLAAGLGETPRLLAEPVGELPQGNGETVMIVDDERSLVALAEETLAALGYEPVGFRLERRRVAGVSRRTAALRPRGHRRDDADLAGVELAREIRRVRPGAADRPDERLQRRAARRPGVCRPAWPSCCASRSSPATSPKRSGAFLRPAMAAPPK